MDFDTLVNEIARRVSEKLETQEKPASTVVADDKPRLLVLTQEHICDCHTFLESTRLGEYYHMECALLQEYQCDVTAYEAAIVYQLDNTALGKLTSSVCDTPFTSLIQKLLLSGKKIFVPEDEVEFLQYRTTAPAPYYSMLEGKLSLLKASGVTVCPKEQLADVILGQEPVQSKAEPQSAPACKAQTAGETVTLGKRVISEKDVIAAWHPGVARIQVKQNAILTDLAKDYAKMRGMEFVRA